MAKPRRAQYAHTSHRYYSPRQLDDRIEERQKLLDESRAGSADAHGELLQSYRPEMLRYFAARLSPVLRQRMNEDDLAQKACIHALRCFARFTRRELRSYWAWLRQICRHVIERFVRWCYESKRDPRRDELLDELSLEDGTQHPYRSAQPSAEKVLETLETAGQLHAALDQLPADERMVICLRYIDGLTLSRIAQRLGVSIDSVKRACRRGVVRLRWRLVETEEPIGERRAGAACAW